MDTKILTRRQARWAEFIAHYDFQIIYKEGKSNGKADALSRRADHLPKGGVEAPKSLLKPSIFGLSISILEVLADVELAERIKQSLHSDDNLSTVLAYFENRPQDAPANIQSKFEDYTMVNGLLLYQNAIYVPKDEVLKSEILKSRHDAPAAGHQGRAKTLELVSRDFFWPSMKAFVNRYVDACDLCQRTKLPHQKPAGLLQPIPPPNAPWTDISYDFIVELPPCEGFDSIFVVVDQHSGGAHFIPTDKKVKADGVAQLFLHNVWKHHGFPERTVSDRGSVFNSHYLRGLYNRLGIEPKFSTAYHPQTDGKTERVNQILEQYLRLFVSHFQNDWVQWLPIAEFCYNNTVSASTGYSPFFVNTGRNPSMVPKPLHESNVPAVVEHADQMAKIHEEVKLMLSIAKDKQKEFFDRGVRESPAYAIGDKVWLSRGKIITDRTSLKLDHKRLGPYEVVERIGSLAYKLKLPPTMKIHPVFHASRLSPFVVDTIPKRTPEPLPAVVTPQGEEEYEVEEILASGLTGGRNPKIKYKVKWKGYPLSDSSWEPLANLSHCAGAIREFHRKYPDAPKPPSSPRPSVSSRPRRGT